MLLEYVERDYSLPSYQISAQYLQPLLKYRQVCVLYTICGQAAILDGNHTLTLSDHLPIWVSCHVRFGEDPSNSSGVIMPTTLHIWNCIIYRNGYTWLQEVTNVFAMEIYIT